MSDCVVKCVECERVWRWLCQFCAEECQVEHRREFGHETHLSVTVDDERATYDRIVKAAGIVKGMGW